MRRKKFLLGSVIVIFALLLIFVYSLNSNQTVAGNEDVKREIDRLLLPVANQNVSDEDFFLLKEMVKKDNYAYEEVEEIILLAKHKEYSHISHSLGFLYDYVKSGERKVCPGHSLAHYFVFIKHDELPAAEHVLEEIREMSEETYEEHSIIQEAISKINSGENYADDEYINILSEIPCRNE